MNYSKLGKITSDDQLKLIAYFAYTGLYANDRSIHDYARSVGINSDTAAQLVVQLKQKGYIVSEDGYYEAYYHYYAINPKYQLLVLCMVYEQHPDYIERFATFPNLIQGPIAKALNAVAQHLVHGAEIEISNLDCEKFNELERRLGFELSADEIDDIFMMLGDDVVMEYVDDIIIEILDIEDLAEVKRLQQRLKRRDSLLAENPYLAATMCLLDYFVNGNVPTDVSDEMEKSSPMLILRAVQTLYAGNAAGSIALFDKCFKILNKKYVEKNVFAYTLFNYFLILAYVIDGSEASRKKLSTLVGKPIMRSEYMTSSLVLGTYFKDSNRTIYLTNLRSALVVNDEDDNCIDRLLCFLLAKYFDLKKSDLSSSFLKVSMSPDKYQPHYAILQHEMSPYLGLKDDKLEQQYGGKPLLASLRKKEQWELTLEEMILEAQKAHRKASSDDTTKEQAPSERMVYIVSRDSNDVEIIVQKRLKSGKWSVGKQVSTDKYNSYGGGSLPLDDRDKEIRQQWKTFCDPWDDLHLDQCVEYLVGSDKVFTRSDKGSRDLIPVNVSVEKPYLSVDKSQGKIFITSNVPASAFCVEDEDGNISHESYEDLDEELDEPALNLYLWRAVDQLIYFPITQTARSYMERLLKIGTLPESASSALEQLFPLISDSVELHSDMIEGGTQLRECEGSALLRMQVIPFGSGQYRVTIVSRPLEGGRVTCVPGEGDHVIFDDVDGERCKVTRHRRTERRNMETITAFLADELDRDTLQGDGNQLDLVPDEMLKCLEYAQQHPEECCVEWPEGHDIKLQSVQTGQWNVSLRAEGGWFELEGDVPVDDDTVIGFGQLLQLMGNGHGRFVRVGEDRYLALTEGLRRQLARIESLAREERGGRMHIPQVSAGLLGDALNGEIRIKHPRMLDELRHRIKESDSLDIEVPPTLNATLRDYQEEGFRWLMRLSHWGAGACLADDMGLGKTVQTIAFLLAKQTAGASMVVAPTSVVPNWKKELSRFAPSLRVAVLNEVSNAQRADVIKGLQAGDLLLTSYGLLITEEESLTAREWNVVCLDEAHQIKNASTKSSAVCMKLQASNRLILTGTPIQNHLGELWNLFQFINPGLLGSSEQFQHKFIAPIELSHDRDRQSQLKRIVQPFMLRRTKQEVVAELPDKQEVMMPVELSRDEMAIYEVIRREAKKELDDVEQNHGGKLNVNVLSMITRLRMASCAASLAQKGWTGASSKLEVFVSLVEECVSTGNRVLVFSQFTSFLEMARQQLTKQLPNVTYFYLDGQTPVKERSRMVDEFQHGQCQVFFISLKAGGLGLNLTGANYVIHLDPWWNPAIEQQATDRAYRIGQEQKVTVYHLISEHTIEEKIVRLHQTKRDLADQLLEGADMSHKLTASDLLQMIGADK